MFSINVCKEHFYPLNCKINGKSNKTKRTGFPALRQVTVDSQRQITAVPIGPALPPELLASRETKLKSVDSDPEQEQQRNNTVTNAIGPTLPPGKIN